MSHGIASRVGNLVLGPPGRQRVRVSQSVLALLLYALCTGLLEMATRFGLLRREDWVWLPVAYLSVSLLFYAVIRSGFNERWASDPSLTVPQTVFGMLASAWAYAVAGPGRGAVVPLQGMVLVFAMFSLRAAQARAVAVFALVLLGGVMLWKSLTDPAGYPAAIEFTHFVSAGIVLACVAILAGRMGVMRARMKTQKLDLQRALERIGELAMRDELTGLFNRRHMGTLMRAEQLRQRRGPVKMTIALIDIDLFKRINDSHGHQAGDAALKAFAEAGAHVLRASDVLSRWGGEEFLLMLPETSPEQALHSVERLREQVATLTFDAVAPGLKLSFSAGVCTCEDHESLDACIERADQAMYRAKTQGRNCTVSAIGHPEASPVSA